MINLHSDKVPNVTYRPPIGDLFDFFEFNWKTLSPALWVLYGILIGFFILGILVKVYQSD